MLDSQIRFVFLLELQIDYRGDQFYNTCLRLFAHLKPELTIGTQVGNGEKQSSCYKDTVDCSRWVE